MAAGSCTLVLRALAPLAACHVMCVSVLITDEVPPVMCLKKWNGSLGGRDSWKHKVVSPGVKHYVCVFAHMPVW